MDISEACEAVQDRWTSLVNWRYDLTAQHIWEYLRRKQWIGGIMPCIAPDIERRQVKIGCLQPIILRNAAA